MPQFYNADVCIIGGGIVGLYALHTLRHLGYHAILLESQKLGCGQTLQSQGIIHGGLKYSLQGFVSPSTKSIQKMPDEWRRLLEGQSIPDLSKVRTLAKKQYLCSKEGITDKVAHFFAGLVLSSKVSHLHEDSIPEIITNLGFNGNLFELSETILDTSSLIEVLSAPYREYIYKVDAQGWGIRRTNSNISSLIMNGEDRLDIQAQCYLFTAGKANQAFLSALGQSNKVQTRPLHMMMMQAPELPSFYGHVVGTSMNPLLTITTHKSKQEENIWYIGGDIAETGVHRSLEEQIASTKEALLSSFPKLNLEHALWSGFLIDRAEMKTGFGVRPQSFSTFIKHNYFFAWPTKLTFTPSLMSDILPWVKRHVSQKKQLGLSPLSNWPLAEIAEPAWDTYTFQRDITCSTVT